MGRKAQMAPAETVRGEVDALAAEMVKRGEAPNLTQARPMIWKERPDLVAASRNARELERGGRSAVGESGKTISDRVGVALHHGVHCAAQASESLYPTSIANPDGLGR